MKKTILFLLLSIYSTVLFSQVDKFIQIRSNEDIFSDGAIQLENGDYIVSSSYYIKNDGLENVSFSSFDMYDYFGSLIERKILDKNNDTVYSIDNIFLNEKKNIECIVYNFVNDEKKSYNLIEYNDDFEIIKKHSEKLIPKISERCARRGLRIKNDVKILFYVSAEPFVDVYYDNRYYRKFLNSWIYDIQILDDKYFYIYKTVENSDETIVEKVKIDGYQIVKTFNIEEESGLTFDYGLGKYLYINNDKLYFYNNNVNYNFKGTVDFDNNYIVMDTGLNEILKLHIEETPEDERNSNYDDYMIRTSDGAFFTVNYLMSGIIRLTKLDSNFDIIFSKVYNIPCFMVTTIVSTIDGGCLVIIDDYEGNIYSNIYKFDKDGNIENKQAIQDKTDFVVYPNPATDFLTIQNTYLLQNSQMYIFNINGQKIQIQNLDNYLNTVDVSNFKTGMYFYQLVKENRVEQSGKFVVRR